MENGRVAGIDYGTVRIGIAISDPGRTIASPVESYTRRTAALDAQRFRKLVSDEGVVLWVVGLPIHLDGRESQKSQEARAFGQWLTQMTELPVEFYDERFSTTQAHQLLAEGQMKGRRRKQRVDMLAAQIMLAAYLESTDGGQQTFGPISD